METLPRGIVRVLRVFEDVFSERVWERVQVLAIGAILAPGQRTVASALRVTGLSGERQYQNYHRVLNRARWSGHELSRRLLGVLVAAFVPAEAPVVVGLDDTIERRRGAKIAAKGVYRDPVRSSQKQVVKVTGLRWLSVQLLAEIPWAGRVWGLPFLTILTPSERSVTERGRRYKTVTAWGWQAVCQVRRWLPDRLLVVVADGAFCTYELLGGATRLTPAVTVITRPRLDAALYDPAPPREPGKCGRPPRLKGKRQPSLAARIHDPLTDWESLAVPWYGGGTAQIEAATGTALWYRVGTPPVPLRWVLLRDPAQRFDPQALVCTDPDLPVPQLSAWFVTRWQVEVTFHELRDHLGVETQRQWSDRAIARTTPALFGRFSLVTLLAHARLQGRPLPLRQAAWYAKTAPTFSDALAFVRRLLWPVHIPPHSTDNEDFVQIPRALFDRLTDSLAFAA
jgi:hypothetical protein